MTWAWDNRGPMGRMLAEHLQLALLPIFFGLVLAVPLGVFVARSALSRRSVLGICAVVESIPVLSWFVFLPAVLGTTLDSSINVLVGLTVVVAVMLTRSIAGALKAVPENVRSAADALGFSPSGRAWAVDVPMALPEVIGGLRNAAVTCVTLTTVAALVGAGGLGRTLTEGFAARSEAEVVSGAAAVLVLAMGVETVLVRLQRRFAPWSQLAPVR